MPAADAAHAEWVRGVLDDYEARLLRYAQRVTKCPERAKDVVQETFLRLCKQSRTDLDGHLAEWLYTVCRNCALDVSRKEQRMTTSVTTATEFAESSAPSANLKVENNELAGHVLALLDDLPDNQQEVIRLKFQGSLSYREIAGVTGLSVTNVGYLLHQGLSKLRVRLKGLL